MHHVSCNSFYGKELRRIEDNQKCVLIIKETVMKTRHKDELRKRENEVTDKCAVVSSARIFRCLGASARLFDEVARKSAGAFLDCSVFLVTVLTQLLRHEQ